MNLDKYNLEQPIYIDSNIFIYTILKNAKYIHSCKTFLTKVEHGHLNAIISPLVLDEVAYRIIVETLKDKLTVNSSVNILRKIDANPILMEYTKAELAAFMFILNNYKGLKTVSTPSSTGIKSLRYIMEYNLLPRDAMHLAIIKHYKIKHIATNDTHFNIIPDLDVWKP